MAVPVTTNQIKHIPFTSATVVSLTTFRHRGGATKEHPHDARRANEAGQVPRHNAQGDHGQDDLTVGVVEEGELPGDGDEDLLIWVNNDEYG